MKFFKDTDIKALPAMIALLAMIGIPAITSLVVQYDYLNGLDRVSNERLTLYGSTFNSALQKYEYLPYLIARAREVKALLSGKGSLEAANTFLETANRKAQSAAIYIMDTRGKVIAASDWKMHDSFIGLDLGFRPYFKEALQGHGGKFFGIGILEGEPGFYVSHPIRDNGKIIGVASTKIALSPLGNLWQHGGETVFVADENGVIILSSRPSWKYRTLVPLSNEVQQRIRERGQYPDPKLKTLQSKSSSLLGFDEIIVNSKRFLINSRTIPGMGWEMSYLTDEKALWERTIGITLTAFVLVCGAILTWMLYRERRQRIISRRQAEETEKFRKMNRQLALEIEERKRTEQELREAQEELVQAGKLAALGEMATAIAHELNQPIAASKTYVASCRLMLSRNKLEDLAPTLLKVSDLCDRMGDVTSQLKSFIRKSSNKKRNFDLRQAVDEALTLMKHQFTTEDCHLQLTMPENPISIMGDRVRLEQVLINLFRNALDSLQKTENPLIGVTLTSQEDCARIHVWDNGPGIAQDIGDRLFEPFVTTKKEGAGVGLGLSISYKIIKDMSGRIRGGNRPGGGAEFILTLPLSRQSAE